MGKNIVATTVAVAACFVLAGCVNSEEPSNVPATHQEPNAGTVAPPAGAAGAADSAGPHNAADVTFTTQMLPHHQQAVQMAKLVAGHSNTAALRQLATGIAQAQQQEITTMQGWLKQWGVADGDSMLGMDHQQMTELEQAHGAQFNKQWLTMMIEHHQDAVKMANTELAAGQSAAAKKMAQDIVTTQQAEIKKMQGMQQSA